MTDYPFDMQLVVDPFNPTNVVANGQVTIYASTDNNNLVPLDLTDLDGVAISNPLFSNSYGFLSPFITNVPQVKWVSGEFGGFFNSFTGLRDAALAAVDQAAASAAAALEAGSNAAAAASAALAGAVSDADASAASALSAQAAATAAQAAAVAAAAVASGGGFAIDPTDVDALLISTKSSGPITQDPSDSDAVLLTL
jgi:hypothetical protein